MGFLFLLLCILVLNGVKGASLFSKKTEEKGYLRAAHKHVALVSCVKLAVNLSLYILNQSNFFSLNSFSVARRSRWLSIVEVCLAALSGFEPYNLDDTWNFEEKFSISELL